MDERDKRRVGEQIEPGGRPKAPGRLELLQRFINSHNHDFPPDWDRIGTPEQGPGVAAGEGARGAGRPGLGRRRGPPARAPRGDPGARDREPGGRPGAAATDVIRRVSGTAQLSVAIDDAGRTALEPARRGVDGAVATLLGILHEAQLSGDWSRMKACRQCEYAFFDRSKNRSAAWCAMSICGNRTKNRAYYRRRSRRDDAARRSAAAGPRPRRRPAALRRPRQPRWRTWSWRRPT